MSRFKSHRSPKLDLTLDAETGLAGQWFECLACGRNFPANKEGHERYAEHLRERRQAEDQPDVQRRGGDDVSTKLGPAKAGKYLAMVEQIEEEIHGMTVYIDGLRLTSQKLEEDARELAASSRRLKQFLISAAPWARGPQDAELG